MNPSPSHEPVRYTREEMRAWMIDYVARLLGVDPGEVDPSGSFEHAGIDSSGAVGMSGDLEDLLGTQFETSLIYDHPSIDALVDHLVSLRLVKAA